MIYLGDLQSAAEVTLLKLINALYESFLCTDGQIVTEGYANMIGHAAHCFDGGYAANMSLCLKCSDARQIGHLYFEQGSLGQKFVMHEAQPSAADVDEMNFVAAFPAAMRTE